MEIQEIVDSITDHLDQDTGYEMLRSEDANGYFTLSHNTTFDICNTPPTDFHAPYFKVANSEQARMIIKKVMETENNLESIPLFDEKYSAIMTTKNFDPSLDLYISVYRPDRIKN